MTAENWTEYMDRFIDDIGPVFKLDESLRECLADDRNPISTATDMVGKDKVISFDSSKTLDTKGGTS